MDDNAAQDLFETEDYVPGLHVVIAWAVVAGRAEPVSVTITADPPRAITRGDLDRLDLVGITRRRRRTLGLRVRKPGHEEFMRSQDQLWDRGRKATGRPALAPGHYEWVSRTALEASVGRRDWVRAVALADGCPCGHAPGTEVHSALARHHQTCTVDTCNRMRQLNGLSTYPHGVTTYAQTGRWISQAKRLGYAMPGGPERPRG